MSTSSYLDKQSVIRYLKHYRFLKNQFMEFQGGWVQTIPELDIKEQFGRQVYTDAQHSELLRQRLSYLGARSEDRQSPLVTNVFLEFLQFLWDNCSSTCEKLFAIDVLLREDLLAHMRRHILATSDPEDEATGNILRVMIEEDAACIAWTKERIAGLDPAGALLTKKEMDELHERYRTTGGFIEEGPVKAHSVRRAFGFSAKPSRPAYYTVIERAEEYDGKANSFETEQGKKRLLHDLVDCEYITVERVGQLLAEFPELPWQMRLQLAKQSWDEARHAEALTRRLEELGGRMGDYPVNYWGWQVDVNRPDPLERLALSNATFEREACKHLDSWIETARATGDEESARVIEFILMDEVTHVQIGKHWVEELTKNDPIRRARVLNYPRSVLESQRPKGIRLDDLAKV